MTTNTIECLLCHSAYTGSVSSPGGSWRCGRCGQRWDANRMATVMDYQRWMKTEAAPVVHAASA